MRGISAKKNFQSTHYVKRVAGVLYKLVGFCEE